MVTNLLLAFVPKPTTVASSPSPYPSCARPVFQVESLKLRPRQAVPGSEPLSRYFQVSPAGMKVTPKIYPDNQTLYQGLLSGQVDADFLDTAIVLAEAKATGGKLQVVGQYKTGEKYGAIYPKGSKNEIAMNQGIATMLSDGTLDQLSKDYLGPAFGGDPSSVPVWTIQ